MDWIRILHTARAWVAKARTACAAVGRRMSRRRWIVAGIAAFLALLAAVVLVLRGTTGYAVFVIRPVADALYFDKGRLVRDDEVLYGMSAVVTGRTDAFGLQTLRTEYGYTVRMRPDDLAPARSAPKAWRSPHTHIVSGMSADVTAEPDLKIYPPLMALPRGARLWVAAEEGDYARISLHDGRDGYVRRALIREKREWDGGDEAGMRARVVADALAYLGVPYRWGGKTAAGIDCSGLASMAYLLNGLAINRNSRIEEGYPVVPLDMETPPGGHTRESLAQAKPGDMLYWKGHQGVYLGDGRYIHANATSFNAAINSLVKGDEDYRADLAAPGAILAWGTVFAP